MNPASPTRRIGLFGGSFDPVHRAHLALGHAALEHLALDELRFVPTGLPWQKSRTLTDAAHRVAMLRLALDGEPRFRIDDSELRRAGPSYSIDTVRECAAREPGAQWFLLVGQDQYAGLPTWHAWRDLVDSVTLAVAGRAGAEPRAPAELAAWPHRLVVVPMAPMDLSSTEIRARAARGEPIDGMVPEAVASYIARHGLYREPQPPTRS